MNPRAPWLALALGVVLAAAPALRAAAEVPVPPLRSRVTDLAELLSPSQEQALEAKLQALEQDTTHQVAVLTVPSLEGESIEDFSLRVVEAWQLGRADVDNGVLFVVAAGDRRLRIEVGYGLEGVLPDAIASRIIRDVVIPHFRAGEMGEGVVAGTEAILSVTRGEALPPAPRRDVRRGPLAFSDIASIVFMAAFIGGMLGAMVGRRRRALGALTGAGVAGGIAWLVAASGLAAVLAAVFGAGFGALGPIGRPGAPIFLPGGYRGHRGGFGGGGFGGGGGGFGGGGASGSW